MKQYVIIIIVALTSSLMTALLGSLAVLLYIVQPFQQAAVDRGFAVWEVVNNATGATKFQWVDYSASDVLAQNEKPLK